MSTEKQRSVTLHKYSQKYVDFLFYFKVRKKVSTNSFNNVFAVAVYVKASISTVSISCAMLVLAVLHNMATATTQLSSSVDLFIVLGHLLSF